MLKYITLLLILCISINYTRGDYCESTQHNIRECYTGFVTFYPDNYCESDKYAVINATGNLDKMQSYWNFQVYNPPPGEGQISSSVMTKLMPGMTMNVTLLAYATEYLSDNFKGMSNTNIKIGIWVYPTPDVEILYNTFYLQYSLPEGKTPSEWTGGECIKVPVAMQGMYTYIPGASVINPAERNIIAVGSYKATLI